jgi:L-asparaginase
MDKKICFIYTGGTIGMIGSDSGYKPQKGYLRDEMERIPDLSRKGMPKWDLIEFDPLLDSSNVSAKEWNRIGKIIAENYEDYDGFVVLHGTDTMAYTASALSFMLEGLSKPVVLTGSQIPIGGIRSDAHDNIISAAIVAAQGKCREVCLCFGGVLLRGNRSTKISADEMIAFDSPNYPHLANLGIDIRYNDMAISSPSGEFSFQPLSEHIPIAVLKVFPGIQFSLFEGIMTESLKGLVLEAFGAGNVPQYDEALIPVLKKAADNGTVIAVCTQCLRGRAVLGTYEVSSGLKSAGAVNGSDLTAEAAVTKLYYLFSKTNDTEKVKELMGKSLRGEMTIE